MNVIKFIRINTAKIQYTVQLRMLFNTSKILSGNLGTNTSFRELSGACIRKISDITSGTCFVRDSQITITHIRWKRTKIPVDLLPEIAEEDLEETFIKGTGPGGQAVNKTSNCVSLMHKPTKILVKCHETRSLEDNRKRARIRLRQKLDYHYNEENSVQEVVKREGTIQRQLKRTRTNKRLEKLRAFKEREGIE